MEYVDLSALWDGATRRAATGVEPPVEKSGGKPPHSKARLIRAFDEGDFLFREAVEFIDQLIDLLDGGGDGVFRAMADKRGGWSVFISKNDNFARHGGAGWV
jgi:hypothetical protein